MKNGLVQAIKDKNVTPTSQLAFNQAAKKVTRGQLTEFEQGEPRSNDAVNLSSSRPSVKSLSTKPNIHKKKSYYPTLMPQYWMLLTKLKQLSSAQRLWKPTIFPRTHLSSRKSQKDCSSATTSSVPSGFLTGKCMILHL